MSDNDALRFLPASLSRLLVDKHGPLTRELMLDPSRFGLASLVDTRQPHTTVRSVCGYCSTGCGLNLHVQQGGATSLSPLTDYPVNLGMACPKGWQALDVLDSPDRATQPLLRATRNQPLTATDWNTALDTFCNQFRRIQQQHGNESVAFLTTGQIPTEEMAFLGGLTKFGMGMVHGDGNTRQCMASAAVAYKQSFGFDAPPFTYSDFEESDTLIFVGANPCIAHPIMWERVIRNAHNPRIVVIDPRHTETAMQATQHLGLRPKSDLILLYGIARILIQHDWIDQSFIDRHTRNFDSFADSVKPYTIDVVSAATGLSVSAITDLAETIHAGKRVSFWWTMGVNQSYQGVRTAQAIINLALMTSNIGRPGTGANSITGQCNAMGSRLFSNTTNLFGGRDFTNAGDRHEVASILDIPVDRIPNQNGWAYNNIIEGIRSGRIRGLWIVGTNPAHSWIDQNDIRELLKRLDFLVVQDMYHNTATAQLADLVLPAAGWGEKDGTFINSERRISVIRSVREAPGQALSDFRIFRLIADRWGCGELFEDWSSPEVVFEKLKALSAGRPCDFSGIANYAMLDEHGGIQWPWAKAEGGRMKEEEQRRAKDEGRRMKEEEHKRMKDGGEGMKEERRSRGRATHALIGHAAPARERRLFGDGRFFHSDGRARFIHDAPRPVVEPADAVFPFILLTGRGTASQWHTQTRTGKSPILRTLYPQDVYVEIHRADAVPLGISDGTRVAVSSRRGYLVARAVLTPTISPGQVFLPMHYESVNQLTQPAFDPHSQQPDYKSCAVRIAISL
jgi:anaerobic selenocysteine-containing dehydrogenase